MTKLTVAVMTYGEEDLSTQTDEWKTFVESNSEFTIEVTEIREPELTTIPLWTDCYFVGGWHVEHSVIPKYVHIISLFWKLLAGQSPCWAGGTWGGGYGIHRRPVNSIPYNVWWWDERYTPEGFNTHGAQIITHEFQNALRWIIHTELGFPASSLPDPYAGGCAGMTLAQCYVSIFSAITDDMYRAIESIFKTVTFTSVPDGATVSIVD